MLILWVLLTPGIRGFPMLFLKALFSFFFPLFKAQKQMGQINIHSMEGEDSGLKNSLPRDFREIIFFRSGHRTVKWLDTKRAFLFTTCFVFLCRSLATILHASLKDLLKLKQITFSKSGQIPRCFCKSRESKALVLCSFVAGKTGILEGLLLFPCLLGRENFLFLFHRASGSNSDQGKCLIPAFQITLQWSISFSMHNMHVRLVREVEFVSSLRKWCNTAILRLADRSLVMGECYGSWVEQNKNSVLDGWKVTERGLIVIMT